MRLLDLIKDLKTILERPLFKEAELSRQLGLSSILYASGIAVAGLATIAALQHKVEISNLRQMHAVNQLHLQYANETALTQVSQLLGSGLIHVAQVSDRHRFIANTQLPAKLQSKLSSGGLFTSPDPATRTWELNQQSGIITVNTCVRPQHGEDQLDEYFKKDGHDSWIKVGACSDENLISTRIGVEDFIDTTNETRGILYRAAIVNAVSVLGDGKRNRLTKKARINYLPASQECETVDDSNRSICNIDHCYYMVPTERNGQVVINEGDKGQFRYKLRPNPRSKEDLWLKVPHQIPQIEVYTKAEVPVPQDLIRFVVRATKPGAVDPFKGPQGVKGSYQTVEFINKNGPADPENLGRTLFQVRPDPGRINNDELISSQRRLPQAKLLFEGFLYIRDNPDEGSLAVEWNDQWTARDMEKLREGCARTVGIEDADFCARLNLTYAQFRYTYEEIRTCKFKGPPRSQGINNVNIREWIANLAQNQPGAVKLNKSSPATIEVKNWVEQADFFQASPWQASNETAEKFELQSGRGDNRVSEFIDPAIYWHHPDNEADISISDPKAKIPHSFEGYLADSLLILKEVRRNENYIPPSPPPQAAGQAGKARRQNIANTANNGILTPFKERIVTLNWDSDCQVDQAPQTDRSDNPYVTTKDFSQCYYVAYYDSDDRLGCSREVPSQNQYMCRNQNGCFAAGTLILMADGKTKAIERIVAGDLVYDPLTGRATAVSQVIVGPQKKPMYLISYGANESLTATFNHPFVTDEGFQRAEDLKVGDKLLLNGLEYKSITQLAKIPVKMQLVWNLWLDDHAQAGNDGPPYRNHLFIANGVIAGDYYIQNLPILGEQMEHLELSKFLQSLDPSQTSR